MLFLNFNHNVYNLIIVQIRNVQYKYVRYMVEAIDI